MDHFPGVLYQIDGETLRALYRFSIRLNDNSTVMSPDERRDLAHRMRALLRKAQPVELGATSTDTRSISSSPGPSRLNVSPL
jgi:hypothetical protein